TQLLPACKGELHLRAAGAEVELRGDEREPALAHLACQRVDLLTPEQKLSVAIRVVVLAVALVVDGDVRADEPGFVAAHRGVRLLEGRPAGPKRLHLGPGQDEAGLHPIEEVVVVPRPAVVDDELLARPCHAVSLRRGRPTPSQPTGRAVTWMRL